MASASPEQQCVPRALCGIRAQRPPRTARATSRASPPQPRCPKPQGAAQQQGAHGTDGGCSVPASPAPPAPRLLPASPTAPKSPISHVHRTQTREPTKFPDRCGDGGGTARGWERVSALLQTPAWGAASVAGEPGRSTRPHRHFRTVTGQPGSGTAQHSRGGAWQHSCPWQSQSLPSQAGSAAPFTAFAYTGIFLHFSN